MESAIITYITNNPRDSIIGIIFTNLFGWIPTNWITSFIGVNLDICIQILQIFSLLIGIGLSTILIIAKVKELKRKKRKG